MVLNGIVLRLGHHSTRLKLSKGESANIVFMNLDVHVGVFVHWKIDSGAEFADEVKYWEEIFTGGTEGHIFCLHGGQSDFCLEFAFPQDRAACNQDDKTSSTVDAVWVLGVFGIVETSKICIRVAVDMNVIGMCHDEAFAVGALEVSTDAFEGKTMTLCELERVPSTLMDSKQDVWMGVTSKI